MARRPTEPGAAVESDAVRELLSTMPPSYRRVFDDDAVRAHAAIVQRRGASAARVEIWRELPDDTLAICVVADDSAGLLSRISAALVAHDIDVIAAQAYCRILPDLRAEAVDFFWVRRVSSRSLPPVCERDIASVGETLDALVRGRASFESAVRYASAVRSASPSARVRFEDDARTGQTIITVQAEDRPGLLLRITRALFQQRVQIVRSEVTTQDGVAIDRFYLTELDGAPLRRARLLSLQTAVLAAVGT